MKVPHFGATVLMQKHYSDPEHLKGFALFSPHPKIEHTVSTFYVLHEVAWGVILLKNRATKNYIYLIE